jgi:hypothetical protein
LVNRTDLEQETIEEVRKILKSELEDWSSCTSPIWKNSNWN